MWYLLFPILSLAEPSILVTANEDNESAYVSGAQWNGAGEKAETALRQSGISFATHGGPGQTRSVFLRGARAEDTLVLLDGIPLNDPLSPSRSFDFSQVPTGDIERIEILKGPQSVLYGSDAMGGVVQFFTRRDPGRPRLRAEGGSYGSYRARASHLGFHAGYERSAGFSAADEREGNTERDAHEAWNLGGQKVTALGENTNLRLQGIFHRSKTDTDRTGGRGGDSAGTFTRNEQLLFRAEATHVENGYQWVTAGSLFSRDRDDNTMAPAYYRSRLWKTETNVSRSFGAHTPTLGAEYYEEAGRSSEIQGRRKFRAGAAFLHDRFSSGRWEAALGGRLDFHSEHPTAANFGLGAGYWLSPNTLQARAHLGSGFKAPTLYQTYSSYGSPSLSPSRSIGGDIGLLWRGGPWEAELGYYANRFRQLIDFDVVRSRYFNIGRAQTHGMEASITRELGSFRLKNSLTTTHAVDKITGLKLLRRPAINNSLELIYDRAGRRGATLFLRYVGKREDIHPVLYTRQMMPAFFTANLDLYYRLSSAWKITARGENLLDRHYQETSGFGTAGRSGYLGVEAEL